MNLSGIGIDLAAAAGAAPKLAKLRTAANQVEAVFLKDLLTEMQKGVQKVSFGQSYGSDIYQDMMNQTLADAASKSGSFGIGKILYQQFSKDVMQQEAARVIAQAKEAQVNVKA